MIRTPDQRVRVFISSTLQELAPERAAARDAVVELRLAPVMFELGASPHAPRNLYRAYLEQSHIFVGIYWQRYGWVAPDMAVSGLEDEFLLSDGKPKLIYVKTPAPDREPRLEAMIRGLEERGYVSYKLFQTPSELANLLAEDLAHLLSERFETLGSVEGTEPPAPKPDRLPMAATSFVGRRRELEDLDRLLEERRLVTLVGAGGSGKTRLALEAASKKVGAFPDGVWFVELAPLTDQKLVVQTVAQVLRVKERPDKPNLETLVESTCSKRLLLLLDNCEHVLDATASLAAAFSQNCPHVHLLATSREALGIPGEQAYRVPSLALPDPKRTWTPEALAGYEAIQLFVDRARLTRPEFELTAENGACLSSLCTRLDGIPLAIELAAARMRSLSLEEVADRLDERFRLLTGGSRTALPRQQTLRALVDWSYDLLNGEERSLLQRLSVFVGGWTLEAAESVCSGGCLHRSETLEVLTSLADKSLVVVEQRPGPTRYRLLETVRQYANDRLLEGEGGEPWRDRHRDHFLALAEEAEPLLKGSEQQVWLERLETEHDNLRAALEWCEQGSESAETALRLAGALGPFWGIHGHFAEGRDRLGRALARDAVAGAPRAKALNVAGIFARRQSDYDAARTYHEESLAICRALGDRIGTANSLNNLGIVAHELGDPSTAMTQLEESLTLYRELDDRGGAALALNNLGNVLREQGDPSAAQPLYEQSLAVFRDLAAGRGIALALGNLGYVALDLGDAPGSQALYEECLSIRRDLGDPEGTAEALEGLALVAAARGAALRAALLAGGADRMRREIGAPLPPNERPRCERRLAEARTTLGDDAAFDRSWGEGAAMDGESLIDYALRASDGE